MSFLQRDLLGYISVLRFRGKKTILVEGPTDKQALSRVITELERHGLFHPYLVTIDSTDNVKLPNIGARETVERVHAEARTAGLDVIALTDREFRRFSVKPSGFQDDLAYHFEPEPGLIWTRGHSMENYFFEPEYAQEYLRFRYPGHLDSNAVDAVATYWREAMQNIAALSISARDARILERLYGALNLEDWDIPRTGTISLLPDALERAATERGVNTAAAGAFRHAFESLLPAAMSCPDAECARWISHGHLGDETIWLAIGRVLLKHGAPVNISKEVATGHREEKRLHRADLWARRHLKPARVETPLPLWNSLGVTIGDLAHRQV